MVKEMQGEEKAEVEKGAEENLEDEEWVVEEELKEEFKMCMTKMKVRM